MLRDKAFLSFLFFFCGISAQAQEIRVAYVGGFGSETLAHEASQSFEVLTMLVSDWNQTHTVPIRIKSFDTKGETQQAYALGALIKEWQPTAVIGFENSNDALALVPTLDHQHIPTIINSATNPEILKNKHYVVQTLPSARVTGQALAQKLISQGKKRIFLAVNTQSTSDVVEGQYFADEFSRLGGKIVQTFNLSIENIDFNQVTHDIMESLSKEHSPPVDALMISAETIESVYLWTKLHALGFKLSIAASGSLLDEDLEKVIQDINGRKDYNIDWFPAYWDEAKKKKDPFFNRFYKAHGEVLVAIASHDATQVLLKAIEKAQGNFTSDHLIKSIKETSTSGLTGHLSFAKDGSAQTPIMIYQVRKGIRTYAK